MLDINICKRCNKKYLAKRSYLSERDREVLENDFNRRCCRDGIVICSYKDTLSTLSGEIDIRSGEPPIRCPYILEQLMTNEK